MDIIQILTAVGTVVGIAVILGLLLAVANKFLFVKEDPRKDVVLAKMPGANCGGCGYPGCGGLVDAIIEGKVTKVSVCKILKADKTEEIVAYLNETQGPDGTTLKVTK